MTDDWPSFRDELSRKGLAELADVSARFDAGDMSVEAALAACSALYATMSGLAHDDATGLVANTYQELLEIKNAS